MANHDNLTRLTRAATKRKTSDEPQPQVLPSKKRVVLGELPTNVIRHSYIAEFKKAVATRARPTKCSHPITKTPKEDVIETDKARLSVVFDVVSDDPQLCGPYAECIYEYLRNMEKEEKRRPLSDYIPKIQKDVTANNRGVLVDWLVELADEFKVVSETLYLTVSYIDRYLSIKSISRHNLQLLGVTAMFIASKYEEIDPKPVEKFCDMTENTYTIKEVIDMEADVLRTLKYEMGNPNVKTFLRKFCTAAQNNSTENPNLEMEYLCNFLAELSLLDYGCVKFLPSTIAASVVFLANYNFQPNEHPWSSSLQLYTGYKPSDLKECAVRIHELQIQKRGAPLEAIRNKYKQQKFKCVSTLTFPPEIPASFFEEAKEDSHVSYL